MLFLVPFYSYFRWCGYFQGTSVSFATTDEFSVRVTKITSKIGLSWTYILPSWFWPGFNSVHWPYYQKEINQIVLNHTTLWNVSLPTFEVFIQILLNVNLSLNQTLVTFLLCVRQTWMAQLILAIFLWEVIFLWSKRILILIGMVLQFMWRKDSLLLGTYLVSFFSSINHLHLYAQFFMQFHLT